MKVYKVKDYQELSRKAANIIAAQVIMKPDCVLGLATGSSPVGTYDNLTAMYEKGDLDFSSVTTVNLDEYKGLDASNDQSYRYFMNTHLFNRVNIPMERTFVPDGTETDSEKACSAYNEILHSVGTVDLQLLGLGHDGHIGFNEPADYFPDETHCVDLTEVTIQANKRFFQSEADVPRQAYTMGIGTIMRAKMVLVVVSGADKADILNQVITGPVTPQVPASILQFHPNAVIIADEAALSKTDL
ncbi:MAG TPA: glucosamine-6-phosphate deaminase [Candidatus Blautia faecavium]|uniref:Glucosamine-6-phosphate deaminase n=1 Tax=Candidatus Blautia faecavium TaxID=2838487 RepID=A0A9D2LSU0_9FIRM|nr:glucosamine-6-phosphate deaminase [Candidatus Blautia faecavium]